MQVRWPRACVTARTQRERAAWLGGEADPRQAAVGRPHPSLSSRVAAGRSDGFQLLLLLLLLLFLSLSSLLSLLLRTCSRRPATSLVEPQCGPRWLRAGGRSGPSAGWPPLLWRPHECFDRPSWRCPGRGTCLRRRGRAPATRQRRPHSGLSPLRGRGWWACGLPVHASLWAIRAAARIFTRATAMRLLHTLEFGV